MMNAAKSMEAATYCRALLAADGDTDAARAIAMKWDGEASPRVLDALERKAAVGLTGAELVNPSFVSITSAFLHSLGHYGAFDRMLAGGMVRVPLYARFGVATGAASASMLNAGDLKPLTALSLSSNTLAPLKAVAHIVMSREFARLGGAYANDIMERELSIGVAAATDLQFVTTLINAGGTVAATGIDARAVRRDLATALSAMSTSAASRLYVLMRASTAKALATQFSVNGDASFPEMGPLGGRLCGMDVIVCDQVLSGDIIVVDASQVVAAAEAIEFRVGTHASVQLASPPDSPPTASTVWTNLWQNALTALLAERFWSAAVMNGAAAVQTIQNAAYGDSPAP